ncbi:MAG: hypothetical protein ACREMN_13055, partial [Gemmatimonadales bacterium]
MYAHTLLLAVATLAQDTAVRVMPPLAIAPRVSALETLLVPAEASLRMAEARLAAQAPALEASLMQAEATLMRAEARLAAAHGPALEATLAGPALASVPLVGWDTQDPADSLYRAARQALNRNQYTRAAELFRAVYTRHARSTYAADAYYWEAFALFRTGSDDALRAARRALRTQEERHPDAATRRDAEVLLRRVQG